MAAASVTALLITYRYWILVPLSFLEGPGIAFLVGTLASRGYFNPYLAFCLLVMKDGIVDGFFYLVGRLGRDGGLVHRLLSKARVTASEIAHIKRLWDHHAWQTMAISKLSWGLSPALLAVAGIVDVDPRTFFSRALALACVQYAILLWLGVYFGHAIGAASWALRLLGYTIAGFVIVVLVFGRRRVRVPRDD